MYLLSKNTFTSDVITDGWTDWDNFWMVQSQHHTQRCARSASRSDDIINKKMFHDQWGTASHTDGQMAGAASTAAQVYHVRGEGVFGEEIHHQQEDVP